MSIDAHGEISGTSYTLDPYGKVLLTELDQESVRLSANNPLDIAHNPHRYGGGYFDQETGLTDLGARYYDSSLGRFVAQDSYDVPNRYNYSQANPIMKWDPDGHMSESQKKAVIFAAGFVVGSLLAFLTGASSLGVWGTFLLSTLSDGVSCGASDYISQGVETGWKNPDWRSLGTNAAIGAGSGLGFGIVGKACRALLPMTRFQLKLWGFTKLTEETFKDIKKQQGIYLVVAKEGPVHYGVGLLGITQEMIERGESGWRPSETNIASYHAYRPGKSWVKAIKNAFWKQDSENAAYMRLGIGYDPDRYIDSDFSSAYTKRLVDFSDDTLKSLKKSFKELHEPLERTYHLFNNNCRLASRRAVKRAEKIAKNTINRLS